MFRTPTWFLRRRRLREQAVDETVLVALDVEAESYGTTLIDLAEMTFHRPALGLRLIGIAESKKALEGRIRHMITQPKPRTAKLGLCGLLAIALAAAALLPMARGERARDAWDARTVALTQGQVDPSHRDHQVSAAALLDSDRELIQQVLALVKQVEENYPQQATHWPAGPVLYHVNTEGRVTVWLYQELWRRDKDCADDEVGWGSSQLVNATGMYYLPDGTPLRSRWYERGGGMKNIRVKIGRRVPDGERVGLILKRYLSPEADLWSRDGRERTILLDSRDDLPVAIIVHVDKPASMGSWRVGNVEANPQASDDFEQLIITGPPLENRGPMLVTVRLPPAATEPSAEMAEEDWPDWDAAANSHAHAVVEEGVGFDGIVAGQTTSEFIKSKLGEPYEERNSQKTGWWLDYRPRYGLDFWLKRQTGVLAEIRLNKGFEGRLRSGISMASTQQEVFQTYGQPRDVKTVVDLEKHFDNQILYRRLNVLGRLWDSKIFYRQRGLLFWFEGDKIKQIVIHAKESAQGEPSAAAAQEDQPDGDAAAAPTCCTSIRLWPLKVPNAWRNSASRRTNHHPPPFVILPGGCAPSVGAWSSTPTATMTRSRTPLRS